MATKIKEFLVEVFTNNSTNPSGWTVKLNGEDISSNVSGVEFSATIGERTLVTLTLVSRIIVVPKQNNE